MTKRIPWVRQRLDEWGRWVTQRCTGSLGWPKRNILAGDGSGVSCADNVPISTLACEQTDRAVRAVASRDLGLWLVLMCRYAGDPQAKPGRRRPMTHAEIAAKLSMSRITIMDRLSSAERIVDAILSDDPQNFHERA